MNNNVVVSVIIPVYNVDLYLKDCINSVLNQTYKNIEIVLIDDGSTDSSGIICDEYSKLDSRIIVKHKSNGGLSSARNAGLELANGQYYTFIDSDDIVSRNMIETMVRLCELYNSDICSCLLTTDFNLFEKKVPKDNVQLSSRQALDCIFSERLISTSASGKLYKAELWNNIRFPEGKLFEDFATIYKVIMATSKELVIYKKYDYYYRPNPSGITGSPFNKTKMQLFDIAEEIRSDVLELYPDLSNVLIMRNTRYAISFFKDCARSHFYEESVISQLVIIIKHGIAKYLISRYKTTSKIYGLLIVLCPKLALYIFK